MKRVHYMIEKATLDGGQSFELIEPGFDDKAQARKGAKSLDPGSYYLVTFDSPTPLAVEPPPIATRNVVKFGKPFIEREKKATTATKSAAKAKSTK